MKYDIYHLKGGEHILILQIIIIKVEKNGYHYNR